MSKTGILELMDNTQATMRETNLAVLEKMKEDSLLIKDLELVIFALLSKPSQKFGDQTRGGFIREILAKNGKLSKYEELLERIQ